ncbi:MAG: selenocysteine-specific translation elongation factor [Mogibacterium sp.]|nr:selenocysteine-specific translation elongation factor [Mogibacterium sp.]
MKNIIIGTAGHVDHGKTQLIKALSGIDTDRLEEEKKRGITIELGFAHIPNDAGYNIGVIDVPGHEKFIKNMLAGIGGIDFVLFVVAADEGIMPQTREHFEILRALGIDDGLIAVTKIDMVDEEWLEMLLEDVQDYFRGSFLEGKPMIPVSSKTGENIDVLKEEIIKKCDRKEKRIADPAMFRLPVDRVFTMSGFGTVVTGTLVDGTCRVNQEVRIEPQGTVAKIRGLQTYGNDVSEAFAGQRTAVNLGGIKKDAVDRGDVLAVSGAVTVTNMIDVRLDVFASADRTVLNNSRVHLYQGSKEALCKVILLDREALGAGESCYAQLRLEEPMALRRGDRFIIRFYSPIITIGGGVVLDTLPAKHKRNRPEVLEGLDVLAGDDVRAAVRLKAGGRDLYDAAGLISVLGLIPAEGERLLEAMVADGEVVLLADGTVLGRERIDEMCEAALGLIRQYHNEKPLADGVPKQELLNRMQSALYIEDGRVINAVIAYMIGSGIVRDAGKAVALTDFRIEYTPAQLALKDRIAELYRKAGIEMLRNDEIYALDRDRNAVSAILTDLTGEGVIVKVDPSYYISKEGWDRVMDAVMRIGARGPFTLAEYRDELGTSRKYAEVFLAALDRMNVTVFGGDTRTVPAALKR